MFQFPPKAYWFGTTRVTESQTSIMPYILAVIEAIPANMQKYSLDRTGALMKGYFHSSCILAARDISHSPQH